MSIHSFLAFNNYIFSSLLFSVCPESKPTSAKKPRRRSTSTGLALSKTGSPSSSSSASPSFNPAAMTERQQMAYLLQMTDPQKNGGW